MPSKLRMGLGISGARRASAETNLSLDHRVRAILVVIGNLRVLSGLMLLLELEGPSLRHIAERRGDAVLV